MVVTCSQCNTKFNIADDKVRANGVKVRCSRCKHTFVVTAEGVVELNAPPRPPPKRTQHGSDVFAALPAVGNLSTSGQARPAGTSQLPPPPKPRKMPDPYKSGDPTAVSQKNASKPTLVETPPFARDEPQMGSGPDAAMDTQVVPNALPADFIARLDLDADDTTIENNVPPKAGHLPLGKDLFDNLNSPPAVPAKPQRIPNPPSDDPFANIDVTIPAMPEERGGKEDPQGGLAQSAPAQVAQQQGQAEPIDNHVRSHQLPQKPDPSPSTSISDDPFADIDLVAAQKQTPDQAGVDPFADIDLGISRDQSAPPSHDPFADIDLGAAQKQTSDQAGVDPFADIEVDFGAKPAASTQTDAMVGNDPFQSMEVAPGSSADTVVVQQDHGAALFKEKNAPTAMPTQPPPMPAEDPFSSLDGSHSAPAMDYMLGHDPFRTQDSGDDVEAMDLQMNADGELTQDRSVAPAAPKSSGIVGKLDVAAAKETTGEILGRINLTKASNQEGPTAPSEPKGLLAYKVFFGVFLGLLIFFVFIVYRSGGKLDLTSWSTYVSAFTGRTTLTSAEGPLQTTEVASTKYINRDGHALVVLWGKVVNQSEKTFTHIVVTGQLIDQEQRVLAELTVPAGITFRPDHVFNMESAQAVSQAYHAAYAKLAGNSLSAHDELDFMIVMFDRPSDLSQIRVRAFAQSQRNPLVGLPVNEQAPETNQSVR